METFLRALWTLFVIMAAMRLFGLVPRIMALSALGYRMPWLPLLPFGRSYAFADLALDGSDGMYVSSYKIPAWAVRWHGLLCVPLLLIPGIGWIASLAIRIAVGGPCLAWALASLEGRSMDEEGLKGAVAAVLDFTGAIVLTIALARHGSRR